MVRWKRHVAGALGLLATLWTSSVAASLVRSVELADVAGRSSHIFRGRVVELESRWNDAQTEIETDVRIAVSKSYKGNGAAQVVLRLPGGVVGDLQLFVSDTPILREGEEIIVFAEAAEAGLLRLSYHGGSVYRVELDDRGGWIAGPTYPVARLLPGEASRLDIKGRLDLTTFERAIERVATRGTGGSR